MNKTQDSSPSPKDGPKTIREMLAIQAADGLGGCIDVLLSHDRLHAIAKRSMGQIHEAGEIVPMVLQNPTQIFEGFCADGDEDRRGAGWRCYVGIPDRSYTVDGQRRPPWEDEVFLVFINADRIAYNWRWEKCDLDSPKLPEGHLARFTKRLMP